VVPANSGSGKKLYISFGEADAEVSDNE